MSKPILMIAMITIFICGTMFGTFIVANIHISEKENFTIIKQTATVKPLGYTIINTQIIKESFVAMEVYKTNDGYDDEWVFRTLNDTSMRQVILHDTRLNVGDLVVYETIKQKKDCDMGVQLKVPDFESVWFEDVLTKNFTENQLPEYYTTRYDITTDFSTCKTPIITKWNSVYRNGELIEKMQLERTGYEI